MLSLMVRKIFCHIFIYLSIILVSKDFLAQTGDPTATGTGGESIWSYLASTSPTKSSKPSRYFSPEIQPKLKHAQRGTVSMAVAPTLVDSSGEHVQGGCGSQFFITLGDNVDYLDGKHAIFGHVVEGEDTLEKINEVYVDQDSRPYKDIRIRHVVILGVFSENLEKLSDEKRLSIYQTILFLILPIFLSRHHLLYDHQTTQRVLLKMRIHFSNYQKRKKSVFVEKKQRQPQL